MIDKFEFTVWDIPSYIMNIEKQNNQLTDENLENISGGKMNRKFLASSLASLTILTGAIGLIKPNVLALDTPKTSQSEKIIQKNLSINQEFTKQEDSNNPEQNRGC